MADLAQHLRALARHAHDDLSIGDEAAGEIERLQRALAAERERCAAICDEIGDRAWEQWRTTADPLVALTEWLREVG
jgi:hypothetical protein